MPLYNYNLNVNIPIESIDATMLYNFKTKLTAPRHVVTYLPHVSDYATSISIASCSDITNKNSIIIKDWIKYLFKNIDASVATTIFITRQFKYFTDDVLISDEYIKDIYGNVVPAFKKHITTKIGANEIIILNYDKEPIDKSLYKYDSNAHSIYHNIDTSNENIYYVSYSIMGRQFLEILDSQPVYTTVDYSTYTSSGHIDPTKKTYSVAITEDGQFAFRINYNPALSEDYDGTYSIIIKPLSTGKPSIENITNSSLIEPWNVDILTKILVTTPDKIYMPIEYFTDTTAYRPVRPFTLKTLVECNVVADHVIKLPNDNVIVEPSKNMHITLMIFAENGAVKHILTTDYARTEYSGLLSNGVLKKFTLNGIVNVAKSGYVMLSSNIDLKDNDRILATYYSKSRSFTLKELNLNPYLNDNIKDKHIYIMLKPKTYEEINDIVSNPSDYENEKTIEYITTDSNDIITSISFTWPPGALYYNFTENMLPRILTTDARNSETFDENTIIYNSTEDRLEIYANNSGTLTWVLYEISEPIAIIGEHIDNVLFSLALQWKILLNKNGYNDDGVKDGIEYYLFESEMTRNKLIIGELFLNIPNTKNMFSTIDARSRGGGIKGQYIKDIDGSYGYLGSLTDIGLYNGLPLQDCGVICASIDTTTLNTLGLIPWKKEITNALHKVIPTGTIIVVDKEEEPLQDNQELG